MATRSTGSRSKTARTSSSRKTASKGSGSGRSPAAGRSDKSVQQFRDALERSVTLSRERLQEVVDEAVARGRMTRGDANELVSKLVSRGRKYSDDLIRDLEKLIEQARREVDTRTGPARRQATRAAGRAARTARDVADPALAEADKLRRRAGVAASAPITAYDQLTATQVKSRLGDLSDAELRKVRTQERRGKARKSILNEIDKKLKR
jgi:polyhydroxyalkanoate synthesis regulator phasin